MGIDLGAIGRVPPAGGGWGLPGPTEPAERSPDATGRGDRLELSPEALRKVAELQARDRDVRAHEAAHLAAGGALVRGGARFTYQRGPDGRLYAIGGEVSLDAGPESDPRATLAKAERLRTAALAPRDPSPTDRAVAAAAAVMAATAAAQLARKGSRGG